MSNKKIEKVYYRIGEVAKILNSSAETIRYYEKEFDLKIYRNRNGERRFTKNDVKILLAIKYMLYDIGMTIRGASNNLHFFTESAPSYDKINDWLTNLKKYGIRK